MLNLIVQWKGPFNYLLYTPRLCDSSTCDGYPIIGNPKHKKHRRPASLTLIGSLSGRYWEHGAWVPGAPTLGRSESLWASDKRVEECFVLGVTRIMIVYLLFN